MINDPVNRALPSFDEPDNTDAPASDPDDIDVLVDDIWFDAIDLLEPDSDS